MKKRKVLIDRDFWEGEEVYRIMDDFKLPDEEELKDWLADTEKAAKICEEKLIEIRCDSFYEYFFK